MSPQEMENEFDVLYNNITSNQAPGLNSYEKSIFLTKAQDEIIKNYFNPKGNKYQEGFDGNSKRQIDFSMLTKVATVESKKYKYTIDSKVSDGNGNPTYTRTEISNDTTPSSSYTQAYDEHGSPIKDHYVSGAFSIGFSDALYDPRTNSKSATIPSDVMMIINERVKVDRKISSTEETYTDLTVVPLSFDEYNRQMSKPFKRPLKYQAWRLLNSNTANQVDIIVGPNDEIESYTLRYIKRPRPIVLENLEEGITINGVGNISPCELDPILHEEILQRAVELAKIAWAGDQEQIASTNQILAAGQRSE